MSHFLPQAGATTVDDHRIWFEASPAACLVLDPAFRILAASDRYLALTMTRREEIAGRTVFDVFPENPDDPGGRGQEALRASLERVLKEGRRHRMEPLRYDIPRPAAEGGGFEERWWAPLNVPAFGKDGRIVGIVHSVEDVTVACRLEEEKAAQEREHAVAVERFQALVQATHDAIWDWDAATDRIGWNENLLAGFGHPPESMRELGAWLAAVLPEDRERIKRSVEEALADPERRRWSGEYRFRRRDGSVAAVLDRGLIVRDGDGAPSRMIGSMQDVTKRVETLEELKRVRQEMEAALRENRRILEHSLDLICVLDEEGVLRRVSSAARRILGREPSEMTGRLVTDFIHPDDRAASLDARERVRGGSPVSTFRNRLLRNDGTAVPLMWSSVWLPEERKSYAVGRDVTELVEAEREITRLGDHLVTTLESISQGCFTVDRDWRFVFMNRRFEELVGRGREELIGRGLWDEFPEGLESPFLGHYERAMEERIKVSFEAQIPNRGWFEVTAHPTPDGIAILFDDITTRKRNAQRLEEQAAAIDQAQDAIIIRDLDHRIRSWNASAERLYGYTAEEVHGRRIDTVLHTDPEAYAQANEVLLREGSWSGELALRRADGSTRIVDGRWSLLRREDGTPHAVLAINTDLTEKKQIEAQFLRAQRLESLGRLAGGIAHDLNNVLSPVLMAVSLLREVAGDDELVRETLDAMEASATRGAAMVRQVLLFARGGGGKRVPVSLEELIDQLRKLIEETFPRGITLDVHTAPDTWAVLGDSTQLHQVLLNLCVNARDACRDGKGTIGIRTENVEVDEQYASMNPAARAGAFVRLEVSDSGSGIPPEIIGHVFEPFFTTKELGSGTGLGLATVQGIVRSHGGWITVYSEKGQGTAFKLYLPAVPDAVYDIGVVADESVPRGQGELILVVDDEASILTTVSRTLESFGYRVMTASDGAEAIALYSRHQHEVDLVLTDMMMPVMDGLALIRALQRLDANVRIIAASGLGANGSVESASGAGVHDFLPKPYTAESMLRLVRQVLDGPGAAASGSPANPRSGTGSKA